MWPVKTARHRTLVLVLGACQIECGIVVGGRWRSDLTQTEALGQRPDMVALGAALVRMETCLAAMLAIGASTQLRLDTVRVVVADTWLTHVSLPWNDVMRNDANAQAFAREQFVAAGAALTGDELIRLDAAPFEQLRLAIAYPSSLISALELFARRLQARLVSVLPLSVIAWGAMPRERPAALGVIHHTLVLVAYGARRLSVVSVRPVSSEFSTGAALQAQWRRMQLRDPQLAPTRLAVFDLMSDPAQDVEPGQLAVLPPVSALGAPSLALGLAAAAPLRRLPLDAVQSMAPRLSRFWLTTAVICVAGVLAGQTWSTAKQLQAANLQMAQTQSQAPQAAAMKWRRDEIDRISAVNGAIRALNLPIVALLGALQPPPDIQAQVLDVELLGAVPIEGEGRNGVRISAQTPTGAEMARYVAFVSEQRPFNGAFLTRHKISTADTSHPYQFTLEATWTD